MFISYEISLKVRSLSEGAVERSETEGVKKIISNYKKLPQSFFCKNDSPLKDGAEAQLNSILYRRDRACPCPQQITYKIKSTDSRKDSRYISANSLGGSKPPPYTGKVNLMLTATTQYNTKSNIYF